MKKNKKEIIKVMDSQEATIRQMPKYNPFQTGTGVHKSAKYPNRNQRKLNFRKEILEY